MWLPHPAAPTCCGAWVTIGVVPPLRLSVCAVEEHCEALGRLGSLSFWWYQGRSRIFGNYSLPFWDTDGRWWYQVKPGLCWPDWCRTRLHRWGRVGEKR